MMMQQPPNASLRKNLHVYESATEPGKHFMTQ